MKKMLVLLTVAMCLAWLLIPKSSSAMDPIDFGDNWEFDFHGYLRQDLGVFTGYLPFAENGNQLAACITTLRGYSDLKMGDEWSFHMVNQFTYEPWYPVEQGAYSSSSSVPAGKMLPVLGNGAEYSQYDNVNDVVREAYAEYRLSNLDVKVGRQIAIWGESLTDVICDVVQPPDLREGFFVGNQEDSRIPQWMFRAIYQLPYFNSSLEAIVSPEWVEDQYRVGWVGQQAIPALGVSGQLFAEYPPNQPSVIPFAPWAEVVHYPEDCRYGFRTNTTEESVQGGLIYWHGEMYMPVTSWGPSGPPLYGVIPTRLMNIEFPMYDLLGFYGNKQLQCMPGVVRTEAYYSWDMPYTSFIGLYTKDIANGTYEPDQSGVVRSNTFKYMIAYDLNGFLYFQWHNTAPFDITLEHVGTLIPSATTEQLEYQNYNTILPVYNFEFNIRIATNWLYNKITTSVVVGYQTFGESGLVMPEIDYLPGWYNNNLLFNLKYYHIFSNSPYEGMGVLIGKDLVQLTAQLNF